MSESVWPKYQNGGTEHMCLTCACEASFYPGNEGSEEVAERYHLEVDPAHRAVWVSEDE